MLDLFISYLIPLIAAIACLLFAYGLYQYYLIGPGDEGVREEGRELLLKANLAFLVLFVVWGAVGLAEKVSQTASIKSEVDILPIPDAPEVR